MSEATAATLVSTASFAAVLHTLIPDHWLPFVLIGRAQGWSAARVAWVSGLSALVHTALSLVLGLAAIAIGLSAAEAVGRRLEQVGAVLLVLFGLAYAVWAWRKGQHFHPGGEWLHGRIGDRPCRGDEGPANPEHLHYHADEGLIQGRPGRGALGLALIVGVNPCVLVLPLVLAAAGRGAAQFGMVALAYGAPTVVLLVALSVAGTRARFPIRLPRAARIAEPASGILIALLGIVYGVLGT